MRNLLLRKDPTPDSARRTALKRTRFGTNLTVGNETLFTNFALLRADTEGDVRWDSNEPTALRAGIELSFYQNANESTKNCRARYYVSVEFVKQRHVSPAKRQSLP